MRRRRGRGGIFRLLVTSYVAFAALLVASIPAALLLSLAVLVRGDFSEVDPYALVDGERAQAQTFLDLGAWLEGLDGDYNVVEVRGDKLDDATAYTAEDLFAYLNAYPAAEGEAGDYLGLLVEAEPGDGVARWLVKLPRDVADVQLNITLDGSGPASGYYRLFQALAVALFVGNCLLVSLFLSRKIKRPLAVIGEGMDRIQRGEQDVELPDFRAKAELEKIRDAFNYMSRRLTEERHARQEMEARKNRLLLDLSHDIKTPVATVRACADALEAGLVPPEWQGAYYRTIGEKAERVGALTGDLFSVVSLEDPDYRINREEIDLAELVRTQCAGLHDEFTAAGLTLEADIPEAVLTARADPNLLARVVENLLGNALKYNAAGKLVRVVLTAQGGHGVLTVSDDGEAIPTAHRETIFDAFTRVDPARSTSQGTGLGLAICKGIVQRHGGEIGYSREGEWNVFRVRLPLGG